MTGIHGFQLLKCDYLLIFSVLYHCTFNIWRLRTVRHTQLAMSRCQPRLWEVVKGTKFSAMFLSFWSCNNHKKLCRNLRGTDCGNPIPSAVCLLRLGWVEGNKELLNKSFSVREEAVIRRASTAAKELLLTVTSGHGPLLPITQPLNAQWIGRRTARWRKHHTKESFTRHTQSHKYFPKRVEPHLSCNLNRYVSAIVAGLWWNMQDRCKHFFKAEREWRSLMHWRLMGTRGRLWFCANCGWNPCDKNVSLN